MRYPEATAFVQRPTRNGLMINACRSIAGLVAALALALGGCAGDQGHRWLGGADTLQLTQATAPAETYETQEARAQGVFERSDSLIYSTWYVESNHPAFPFYTITPECSGRICTVTDAGSGRSYSFDKFDLSDDFGERRPILTKNGITAIEAFNPAPDEEEFPEASNFRSYGSWLSHSAFAVETFTLTYEIEDGSDLIAHVRSTLVGGELTGAAPGGSAIWRGLMVGTPPLGPHRGDFLQGDAALVYDLSGGMLNAAFTNIVNLDKREPHGVPRVVFADIPVSADGTYSKTEAYGERIQGGFYGPDQAETAGIFEKWNIVGAFGARRQ